MLPAPLGRMLLHVGAPPAPHDLPGAWTLDPLLLGSLALASAGWVVGAPRMQSYASARARWFWLGMGTLVVALVSPLDALGEALFSAHMVQHLLLITVAAPLLVLSEPVPVMLRALPRPARRRIARALRRGGMLRTLLGGITLPPVALTLHLAALWCWHLPTPYQAALARPAVHVAEHSSFFLTALAFWWVVLRPLTRRGGEGAAIALAFLVTVQCGVLGALITFASSPWYPAHGPGARLWGVSLLADQQLAGLIMWVPTAAPYLAAALLVLGGRLRRHALPAPVA